MSVKEIQRPIDRSENEICITGSNTLYVFIDLINWLNHCHYEIIISLFVQCIVLINYICDTLNRNRCVDEKLFQTFIDNMTGQQ